MPEAFQRQIASVHTEEYGQATIEYLLLAIAVALPIGIMLPVFLQMIVLYFYRFAAMAALPIP